MAGAYSVVTWDDMDPGEVINDGVDFSGALDTGDSLATIVWTFLDAQGVTKTNPRIDGTLGRVTLTGGIVGQTSRLLCTVTTVGGETLKQVVRVKIKTKN